jgi:pimeloyl-ACP methyl ester carboxylesterase
VPTDLDTADEVVDSHATVEDHPDVAFARLHGHEVAYLAAGEGPVVVLVHGIAGSSGTWAKVLPSLAEQHTVIAPDLLGHGQSAKPRGDYSLGAYASGIRDLLTLLGHERATFVGHSLGGGIAMQLAYQFPQMCERLVLVASGGLGREVNPLLRLVSLPGAELVLPLVLSRHIHGALGGLARRLGAGVAAGALGGELWRSYTALTQPRDQAAFVHTVRSVIDLRGQRVSARDRLYLAADLPTLIVWGDRDRVIPVGHAHAAHALIPNSRLEVVRGAGHFVPLERPATFSAVLEDFLASTTPAAYSAEGWQDRLVDGDPLWHASRSL